MPTVFRFRETVLDKNGNVLPGASVLVTKHSDGSAATLYDESGEVTQANPTTTDAKGVFEIYVTPGRYDITAQKGGFDSSVWDDVLMGPYGVILTSSDSDTPTSGDNDDPKEGDVHVNLLSGSFFTFESGGWSAKGNLQGPSVDVKGYATKADMDADLTPPDQAIAYVTNDPTAANNGVWRKSGATGTGSWVQSSYDRVAEVESNLSLAQEKLANYDTHEKIPRFYNQTRNLLNLCSDIPDKLIGSTGGLSDSPGSLIKDLILPETTGSLIISGGVAALPRATFKDADGFGVGAGYYAYGSTTLIPIPAGAYRVYFQYDYLGNKASAETQIEYAGGGQTEASAYVDPNDYNYTPYDQFSALKTQADATAADLIEGGGNLLGDYQTDVRIYADGPTTTVNAGTSVSGMIPVTEGDIYVIGCSVLKAFDADQSALGSVSGFPASNVVTLPAGTAYVMVQFNTADAERVFVSMGVAAYDAPHQKDALTRFSEEVFFDITPALEADSVYSPSDVRVTLADSFATPLVPVTPGEMILFTAKSYNTYGGLNLYAADQTFLRNVATSGSGQNTLYFKQAYQVEEDVAFVRVSTREDVAHPPQIWSSRLDRFTDRIDALDVPYPDFVVQKASGTQYYIFVRQFENVYLRYDLSIGADVRLGPVHRATLDSFIAGTSYSFTIGTEYVMVGKWELAVSVGGSFIGHDTTNPAQYYSILLDGVDLAAQANGYYEGREVQYMMKGIGTDPVDSTQYFEDFYNVTVDQDGVIIDTTLVGLVDTPLSSNAFLAMCPVNREVGGINITNHYADDTDLQFADVSAADSPQNGNPTEATKSWLYGDEFSVQTEILFRSAEKPTRSLFCTNADLYNKIYVSFGNTGETLGIGEKWRQITRFRLKAAK